MIFPIGYWAPIWLRGSWCIPSTYLICLPTCVELYYWSFEIVQVTVIIFVAQIDHSAFQFVPSCQDRNHDRSRQVVMSSSMPVTLTTCSPKSRYSLAQAHRCIADKCLCLPKNYTQHLPDILVPLLFKDLWWMVFPRFQAVVCIRLLRTTMVTQDSMMIHCSFLTVWLCRHTIRSVSIQVYSGYLPSILQST